MTLIATRYSSFLHQIHDNAISRSIRSSRHHFQNKEIVITEGLHEQAKSQSISEKLQQENAGTKMAAILLYFQSLRNLVAKRGRQILVLSDWDKWNEQLKWPWQSIFEKRREFHIWWGWWEPNWRCAAVFNVKLLVYLWLLLYLRNLFTMDEWILFFNLHIF